MAKKKIQEISVNPTLKFAVMVILGTSYKLCLRFREYALAKAWLSDLGVQVDLLREMPQLDERTIVPLLAAALHAFHPQLTYAEIEAMVDYDTFYMLKGKIEEAFLMSLPERVLEQGKENPPEPVQG